MRCLMTSFLLLTLALFVSYHFLSVDARKGPKITEKVFFDITIGGEPAGTIVLGLYGGFTSQFTKFC